MSQWRSLRFDFQAMASPCSLQLDGRDERLLRRAARAAMDEVHRIEAKFSRYQPGSVVSRINRAAGQDWVALDAETAGLLDFAHQLWQQSDGLFDISSGVLRQAWNFRAARLPDPGQLNTLRRLVGWQRVERGPLRVRLPEPGMELDFGGFGKEYAADRAAAVLLSMGVRHGLVNLGGDLMALGPRGIPDARGATRQPWRVDLQHPRPEAGQPLGTRPLATLELGMGGLATSGDYERFFVHAGQRYCHVLDPRTGWPVQHWQSVSVLSANATSAGALSTVALLKGADAPEWLQQQGVRFLAVRHDGVVFRQLPEPADPGLPPAGRSHQLRGVAVV